LQPLMLAYVEAFASRRQISSQQLLLHLVLAWPTNG